jgi:bifunctional non-homologous end joining protein LigD
VKKLDTGKEFAPVPSQQSSGPSDGSTAVRHAVNMDGVAEDSRLYDGTITIVGYNPGMLPRNVRPIRLSRRAEPFDSDQYIFELKIDGFRALAHIDAGHRQLISRNGNTFRGFADLAAWIAEHLRVESAVLDGEIACVDEAGRPVFRDLLFRRRQCVFIAFDLLYLNGKDLRTWPLIKRKAMLKKLLTRKCSRILYLDHVEGDGRLLFEQIAKMDLEGLSASIGGTRKIVGAIETI